MFVMLKEFKPLFNFFFFRYFIFILNIVVDHFAEHDKYVN